MNSERKTIIYRLCVICGDVYGVSGQTAFGLAQRRPATRGPDNKEMTGVCPKHNRKDGDVR